MAVPADECGGASAKAALKENEEAVVERSTTLEV